MRKVILVLAILFLVAGIGIISFPQVERQLYRRHARALIADFETRIDEYREEMRQAGPGGFVYDTEAGYENLDEGWNRNWLANWDGQGDPFHWLYREMESYNERLYQTGQSTLGDPFTPYSEVDVVIPEFELLEDMIAYIAIPRMNIELPIFLGASYANLDRGAVLMMQTSLPVGGENTNAVISAHRGLRNAVMFRDIEDLQIGDVIYITNFYETLSYAVVETRIIWPQEVSNIRIQSGRDMITLLTCHPYRRNYQRYLVFAERIT